MRTVFSREVGAQKETYDEKSDFPLIPGEEISKSVAGRRAWPLR